MEPHKVRGCPVTDQSKILAACLDACSMETWTINLDGIRSTLAVVADGLESDQGAALAWLTGDLRPSSTSRSRKPARRSPTACTDSFMRRQPTVKIYRFRRQPSGRCQRAGHFFPNLLI